MELLVSFMAMIYDNDMNGIYCDQIPKDGVSNVLNSLKD